MVCADPSTPTADLSKPRRRRSRSDSSALTAVSSLVPAPSDEETDVLCLQAGLQSTFQRRSASEIFVRTADGVMFQDEAFQRETRAKAERLVEMATNPGSSERNALIAKKALRYREMRAQRPMPGRNSMGMHLAVLRAKSCPAQRQCSESG